MFLAYSAEAASAAKAGRAGSEKFKSCIMFIYVLIRNKNFSLFFFSQD
jgi:hypothetical protein